MTLPNISSDHMSNLQCQAEPFWQAKVIPMLSGVPVAVASETSGVLQDEQSVEKYTCRVVLSSVMRKQSI